MTLFSDDRFMTLATGLVLAIVVGTLAQQSDSLMAFFTGEEQGIGEDDQYTIRAGSDQSLDVLGNDTLDGEIIIVNAPSCGRAVPDGNGAIDFVGSEACTGVVTFNYCVEFEEGCVESEVSLSMVVTDDTNSVPVVETTSAVVVAAVPTTQQPATDEPNGGFQENTASVISDTVAPGVVNSVDEQVAGTSTQGDRLNPGQILLQDDDEGTSGVRFGDSAPSLFTPNTDLITPHETVDVLRQSVAAIQPAQVDTDQGLQTQTSTSRPTSTALSTGGLQQDIPLGTEAAPTIAFSAPVQPRLGGGAPSMLQPVAPGGGADTAFVIEHGPDVHTDAPANIEIASDSTATEPVSVSDEVDALIIAAELEAGELFEQISPSTDRSDTVDTETADAGDVLVGAEDPSDSSDIVVETAALILLPGPQLEQQVDQSGQASPETEALLSDKIFSPDLEVSAPPVNGTDIASLPEATDTVTDTLGGTGNIVSCGVDVNSAARPGAAISLYISSSCRANRVVTIEHSGLLFTAVMNDSGTYSTVIPAFTSAATVNVSFDDGATAQERLVVQDADDIRRIAIVWAQPVSIDLHAYEADGGSDGHVWVENPRRYRDTLTGGGGYLETFGDIRITGGTMAEVYSLPTNRLRSQNDVRMELRVTDATQFCAQNMVLRTVQSAGDTGVAKREFNLGMPSCGAAAEAGMVLENLIAAISVVAR